jgi:hypothetical protein
LILFQHDFNFNSGSYILPVFSIHWICSSMPQCCNVRPLAGFIRQHVVRYVWFQQIKKIQITNTKQIKMTNPPAADQTSVSSGLIQNLEPN